MDVRQFDETISRDEFEQVNAELETSLKKCRQLLTDCRSKLAANGNEPETLADKRRTRA